MLKFEWIWMFLALPLALLVRLAMPEFESRPMSLRIPHFSSVRDVSGSSTSLPSAVALAMLAAWIFLVAAAARPVWIEHSDDIVATGRDMILAIDASGSMKHTDFAYGQNSRFEAVQEIAGDFLRNRRGDRIGLIIFGTRPYLHAPLTFDTETVAQFLHETQVGFAGQRTAIGDTVGLAVKVLRTRPQSSRVLVLLTDGENTDGQISPRQAAQLARESEVRIYAIGIGDELISKTNPLGQRRVSSLEHFAEMTEGAYFHASDPDSLRRVYELIDEFEAIDVEDRRFLNSMELYPWPLAIAVALFALAMSLRWMPRLVSGDAKTKVAHDAFD